eukprot:3298495-Prymnesium_polylepis.2
MGDRWLITNSRKSSWFQIRLVVLQDPRKRCLDIGRGRSATAACVKDVYRMDDRADGNARLSASRDGRDVRAVAVEVGALARDFFRWALNPTLIAN